MFHETPSIYTASSSCLTFGNPSLSWGVCMAAIDPLPPNPQPAMLLAL
jgi:hypothetical protein